MEIVKQCSIDSQTLIKELRKLNVGEIMTYKSMSESIGRDVLQRRHVISTARNRLLNDEKIVFGTVAGIGIKRLGDNEMVGVSATSIKTIRRASLRGLKVAACADEENLSVDQRKSLMATISHLGVLRHASSPTAHKKIEQSVVQNNTGLIPEGIALDVLK